MPNTSVQEQHEVDISEKIFANAPNMLMLCLTAIGLIKIYTRFEKITTLADNFLSFVSRFSDCDDPVVCGAAVGEPRAKNQAGASRGPLVPWRARMCWGG